MKLLAIMAFLLSTACGSVEPTASKVSVSVPAVVKSTTLTPVIKMVAGAMRYDPITAQWVMIENQYHMPMNVDHLETFDKTVQVYYSFLANRVVSFMITTDETYALAGIFVGASVGLDYARVHYAHVEGGSAAWLYTTDMNMPGSNFFFQGYFEVLE